MQNANENAIHINDNSLSPRYKKGEFLTLDNEKPQYGNDFVVTLKDGRKLIKRLISCNDKEMKFCDVNDDYETFVISLCEIEKIERVRGRIQ